VPEAPEQPAPQGPDVAALADELRSSGVRRIHVLAWRDLDDPEAGGSEVHADAVMQRWAAAGLEVLHRTSAAKGRPAVARRNGYEVVRRGSRYGVFGRAAVAEASGRHGRRADALVEIWNGVPWFSPVWFRGPKAIWLHHVHGPMWDQIFSRPMARAGRWVEAVGAPPFYRRSPVVTLAEASRDELVHLGFPAANLTVVPPGVDPSFHPGGERSVDPLVMAVGRLAPVKRFDVLLDALVAVRASVPELRVEIVGDGPLRRDLEARVDALGARDWVSLPGRVPHDELVRRYQSAWLVASASLAEGWGMTLTEAAACGTPAVALDNVGHRGAVLDGITGVLVPAERDLGAAVAAALADETRRAAMGTAAIAHASTLRWDRTAGETLAVLAADVRRRR
jgi:glycosyltransferase involved in cell wall biosynthesis